MTKTIISAPGASRPSAHVHPLVKETAEAMAHELYDTVMLDNEWYRVWKSMNPGAGPDALARRFVRKNLARLLPAARAMLAGMLATSSDEALKSTIYDALLLDNTLLRGRTASPSLSTH